MLCPDQCDPKWQNCSGDGMQFICLDDEDDDGTDPVTTPGPKPTTIKPEPASVCRDNHLYDQDFVLYDSKQEQSTYKEGTTVDISCAKYTYPTLNRVSFKLVNLQFIGPYGTWSRKLNGPTLNYCFRLKSVQFVLAAVASVISYQKKTVSNVSTRASVRCQTSKVQNSITLSTLSLVLIGHMSVFVSGQFWTMFITPNGIKNFGKTHHGLVLSHVHSPHPLPSTAKKVVKRNQFPAFTSRRLRPPMEVRFIL